MATAKKPVTAQLTNEEFDKLQQAKNKISPDEKGEKSVRTILMAGVEYILQGA